MSPSDLSGFSMHELFRAEVESQKQLLTDGLVALDRTPSAAPQLEACMRAAHSLKGAARIVGLGAAVSVAHAMEDCFVAAQQGTTLLGHAIIDALLGGVDLLGRIAAAQAAEVPYWSASNPAEVESFRSTLAALLARPTAGPAAAPVPLVSSPLPTATAEIVSEVVSESSKERVLRVNVRTLNRIFGLAGESLIESRWLEPFIGSLSRLKRLQREVVAALESVTETDAASSPSVATALEKMTECQRLLGDRVTALEQFERRSAGVANRLYDEALASQMRPFGDGAIAFPRMVRDLGRELGKVVRLEIIGEHTAVDRDVLQKLEAPLTHLLRNAVDHGVESGAERQAVGKPAEGVVRLEAHHVSGLLEITVSDDGQGIGIDRVRRAVVSRGLTDAQTAQRLSETELLEFLFLPGFTLKDSVTEISGRGVGLDAVQNMVKQLRGTVRVFSQPGRGVRFQLLLPLTTSVVRTLVVDIGDEPYAFPLAQIVSTMTLGRDEVELLEGRQHFFVNGRQVGLVPALQVLHGSDFTASAEKLSVLVVGDRSRGHEYGLAVDRFRGTYELVVQPLDTRLGKIKDISAGALLNDGTPLLIVDVDDLIQSVERLVSGGQLTGVRYESGTQQASQKRVLVVDDSLTVRELERKLIESGGYAVEVAVDGVDGWNAVRLGKFDLVITDIDMPRMDGIELVGLIKKDARLGQTPVMVVSYKDRAEDRRRGLEAGADFYLAKGSFHDKALLQAVMDLIGDASA